MRQVLHPQMKIGEVDISEIIFKTKSRDEVVKVLKGLQHLYLNNEVRDKLFDYLERIIPKGTNKHTGRPEPEVWHY